jgi:hypothetical protein
MHLEDYNISAKHAERVTVLAINALENRDFIMRWA